ncbi:hypothetical protein BV25DRAFT_1907287 [Artomyces pyxidatus]|uniref:Uncharacterized protein n=1 Tax=Artomyces pyxidatus TaxID=48021 RepID=A0ACB8T3W5_9AGAM|nr:hypothetical protein BV25DRAFT_1907287 [Artomyces pyxidatus]
MARATRSAKHQDDKQNEQPPEPTTSTPSKAKAGSKKRKRTSISGPEEQPSAKQARTDDAEIKEEDVGQDRPVDHELKGAGDVPLDPEDAQRILDILEMVDTQGLLDRVFPLPADPADTSASNGQSSSQPLSYSFRTLLKDSPRHPLRVLRSAVQPLFPVFAHPRSRPSAPAAQQLKFCNLALSLLDQSSFNSSQYALELVSIIPDRPDAVDPDNSENGDVKPTTSAPSLSAADIPRKLKYALMQKLPTGEWWTSLKSDFASFAADGRELKDLPTAHAELVAVLPDASVSSKAVASTSSVPTLGSYTRKSLIKKPAMPGARKLSTGAFLDYGPYASFAPTFDQDGVEVGRCALGEVLFSQENKRRIDKAIADEERRRRFVAAVVEDVELQDDTGEVEDVTEEERSKQAAEAKNAADEALETLLPPEEVASIKAVLGTLELEAAVQELLDRNTGALKRLEELQLERLGGEGGGSSTVAEGSEEWDLAQGIAESLTLLASLRPRSSTGESPLIPSPAVLRKLQRTIPVGPSEGWYGSLPADHPTALRDDTTLHIKSGAKIIAPLPAPTPVVAPAPAVAAVPATPYPAAKTTAPATGYTGYGYPNYNTQYRGTYPYTPSTNPYYPNAYAQAPTPGQTTPASTHYPSQQYTAGAAQQQYYGSWYNYQQPPAPGVTPPAAASSTPPVPTSYATAAAGTARRGEHRGRRRHGEGCVDAPASGRSGVHPDAPRAHSRDGDTCGAAARHADAAGCGLGLWAAAATIVSGFWF